MLMNVKNKKKTTKLPTVTYIFLTRFEFSLINAIVEFRYMGYLQTHELWPHNFR